MLPTYEGTFEDFLMHNMEFAMWAWEASDAYKRIGQEQAALQKQLLRLIPPKKHKKAKRLLEDLIFQSGCRYDFYYTYGFKDGVRHLKLLGVL